MKKFINESNIPEEKEEYSANTSYVVNISKTDREALQRMQSRYASLLIDKRMDEFSSFIKVILLNTYLYLTNMERDISEDIAKIAKKSYYKDLSDDFKKMISESSKEQDFIKELIRTRMLKADEMEDEGDEKEPYQFRLAKKGDEYLKYIFYGSTMPLTEYLTSLLDYFISATYTTKQTILYYQILLSCKRCVKDQICIMVNGRKLIPVQIAKKDNLASFSAIWAFDRAANRLRRIHVTEIREFEVHDEYYSLTADEKKILSAMQKCDKVTISFDVVNTENRYVGHYTDQRMMRRLFYDVKYDEETKRVELTINSVARAIVKITHLKQLENTDIANLNYSDNLKNFLQVMEETGISFRFPMLIQR